MAEMRMRAPQQRPYAAGSAAGPPTTPNPASHAPTQPASQSPSSISPTTSSPPPSQARRSARRAAMGIERERERRSPFALSLFWRTFFLLALLLGGGVFAWLITLRQLEFEPRAVQAAQQIASLVNVSREALRFTDQVNRTALVKSIADQESVRLLPREPADVFEPFASDRFSRRISAELQSRLGQGTVVAQSVNGVPGLWVGISIDKDQVWLQADPRRLQAEVNDSTYFVWIGIALVATLLGSAGVAGLINRPLEQLSFAASRIRDGEFDSRLDERTATREIREVNMGFNRMARELAKVEEDRAVMLAGISHDLRTPLARLRLEAEMSVEDDDAKRNMASDIEQLDAIIDKFMDYARPGDAQLVAVPVSWLLDREIAAFRDTSQLRIESRVAIDVRVMADETELGRVFANLFENARRYGRSTNTGIARVQISHVRTGPWVILSVRDHGPGVAPEKIAQLTTPFFRGDAARTAATGAGLGLAIVDKAVQRMGGQLEITNAHDGGLVVHIRLKSADAPPAHRA